MVNLQTTIADLQSESAVANPNRQSSIISPLIANLQPSIANSSAYRDPAAQNEKGGARLGDPGRPRRQLREGIPVKVDGERDAVVREPSRAAAVAERTSVRHIRGRQV